MPVYQLLGGKTVDAIDCGYVLMAAPAEQLIGEAKEAFAHGFKIVKFKPAIDFEESIRTMIDVSAGLGDDARLMIDVNGMWNYDQAFKALRRWEKANVNLELIEQPLPYWDIEGMARLRGKVATPIWADESARELQHLQGDHRPARRRRAVHQDPEAGGLLKSQPG